MIKNGLYPVGYFDTNGGRIGSCWVIIMVLSWFGIGTFLGAQHFWWFHITFFLGIFLSGVTLNPASDKRETSVVILDSKNIYFGSDVYNWLVPAQDALFALILWYEAKTLYLS